MAEICAANDVLFIADEVMSGFGRTGRNFAIDHWGVVPDILVGGKGLAGGYAAMGGIYAKASVTAPIAERGHNFMFFTFGAQSAHCAVADKVLEIMEREDLVARAATMGTRLRARLDAALGDHPNVSAIRGLGLMQGIELVAERDPHTWATPGFAARVGAEALGARRVGLPRRGRGPGAGCPAPGPAVHHQRRRDRPDHRRPPRGHHRGRRRGLTGVPISPRDAGRRRGARGQPPRTGQPGSSGSTGRTTTW